MADTSLSSCKASEIQMELYDGFGLLLFSFLMEVHTSLIFNISNDIHKVLSGQFIVFCLCEADNKMYVSMRRLPEISLIVYWLITCMSLISSPLICLI